MEFIEIGLWVMGGMFVFVLLGMCVVFVVGMVGMIGLIWIFWFKKNYGGDDFIWVLMVVIKIVG